MLQFITDHLLAFTVVGICSIFGLIVGVAILNRKRCPDCNHTTCRIEFLKVVMSTDKPEQVTDFLVLETATIACTNPECSFTSKRPVLLDLRYPTYADLKETLEAMQK